MTPRRRKEAAATALRLSDLDPQARRKALAQSGGLIALVWIVLLVGYYQIPFHNDYGGAVLVRLILAVVVFIAILAVNVQRITKAELPELRAVEALAVSFPLLIVLFSSIYLTLSQKSPNTFSVPLDHTGSLYFTMTTFSTVGYGDIVPKTDGARIIVMFQFISDLVFIGVVVRLLTTVAQSRLAKARVD
jgi:hypothetical protein